MHFFSVQTMSDEDSPSASANLGSSGPGVENQGSEPLPKGFFGPNSPTKRKSTSMVWQHIKRLKSAAVEAQREGSRTCACSPLARVESVIST